MSQDPEQITDAPVGRHWRIGLEIGCLLLLLLVGSGVMGFWGSRIDNRVGAGVVSSLEAAPELEAEIHRLIEQHALTDLAGNKTWKRFESDIDKDGTPDRVSISKDALRADLSTGSSLSFIRPSRGFSGYDSAGLDDVNGDGWIDAWYNDPGDAVLRIFWGSRWFPYSRKQLISPQTFVLNLAFHDCDGDGQLDIVFPDNEGGFAVSGETDTGIRWIKLGRLE